MGDGDVARDSSFANSRLRLFEHWRIKQDDPQFEKMQGEVATVAFEFSNQVKPSDALGLDAAVLVKRVRGESHNSLIQPVRVRTFEISQTRSLFPRTTSRIA